MQMLYLVASDQGETWFNFQWNEIDPELSEKWAKFKKEHHLLTIWLSFF